MNEPAETERTELRILVVDLETSSLNARAGGILEIGATWLMGGRDDNFTLRVRLRDGAEWDPESEARHGITLAEASDLSLPTEREAICAFVAWIGNEPVLLAGLNPSFDRAWTHEALRRAGSLAPLASIFPHRVIDLHTLAISYALAKGTPIPPRGFYTDAIYQVLGMPEEPKPHRAVSGALWEAEALRMLLGIPGLTEPVPYEVTEAESGRWGIYFVNMNHWVFARSAQEAFELCCQQLDYSPNEEVPIRLLSAREMDSLFLRSDHGKTSLAEEFLSLLSTGVTEPCLIGSIDR